MTIFFPDISSFQAGVSFTGCPYVCVKATEGTVYVNPDYKPAKARAAQTGTFVCAYHMLHHGAAAEQASHAYSVVGKTPLMLDFEPTTDKPVLTDALAFVNSYRALGGVIYLLYLPHWYWAALGSPSLSGMSDLGMALVSSDYTSYSDTGPGWNSYGGMTPAVWQYTSSGHLNGASPVDWNAFKGNTADLISVATTGALSAPNPTLTEGDSGPAVVTLQERLNVWGSNLAVDGQFGTLTYTALRAFQAACHLGIDGVAGPQTWAALLASPPHSEPSYPAPSDLAVSSVSLTVSWRPVVINAVSVASYQVQAVGLNGEVYASQTTQSPSATLTGLEHGWTYNIIVSANGGPVAPLHASITVTV